MIKPINNNIVLKQLESEEKTESGIILPDSAKEKPQIGEVIESSTDSIKKGDKVLYKKWGGSEVTYEGKVYLIVEDIDILAVL